ncbi:transcription cofactor vestigial-like protein 3 [Rana temporaria]|uniref:transcription cofactor vestigial-like protein 3 n=1 Tax=Rana temporaria TaxID=8407 RepID=UPI001AACF6BF|nr:transcription cofactor vestigial-like protein 3 [Rana temporaria]
MSCLDVMYHHQVYGMHQYLPGTAAAAAYYHHHPQKKIGAYSKMQETLEVTLSTKQEEEEKEQPAEMEYLNSRCVLLTYFHGDIGAVVDEHFSRALSQLRTLNPENTSTKTKAGASRESPSISCQRTSLPPSLWTNSYQSAPPCLSGVHPDFATTTASTLSTTEHSSWPGDNVHQTVPHPPPVVTDSWHYPLASPTASPYAHMHDIYMYRHHAHPHMHHHHHHHHHPSSHVDPRYGPLVMPSMRAARIPAAQCDIPKTEATTPTMATPAWAGAFHGTVDIVPSFGFETGNGFSA